MMERNADDAIRLDLTVPVPPARAFAVFAEELDSWWPPEYTWAGDVLETIAIEPREGGRCFERGPHGFKVDWGRVLAWEPPHSLLITWQISPGREPVPDPDKASEIEVRFQPEGADRTRVAFEHRHLARHGAGSEEYRTALAAQEGWPYILDRYAAVVAAS